MKVFPEGNTQAPVEEKPGEELALDQSSELELREEEDEPLQRNREEEAGPHSQKSSGNAYLEEQAPGGEEGSALGEDQGKGGLIEISES